MDNLPGFVREMSADSITPGRSPALTESYGANQPVVLTLSGSCLVPTTALETSQGLDAGVSHIKCKTESDNNIQAADSNSPKQTFVPCKVCGDRASGFHYGVTSCEGCKGFFRRSIQKQIEYRCLRDGKCMVIRLNRNRCQYCRFKKCLAVGMSRDSVRYGRVPKRSKSQDEQHVTSTDTSLDPTSIENKQLAIYDIILNVSQAHHTNCGVTEDKVKVLQRKNETLMKKIEIPDTLVQFSDEELESQRMLMWQCFANYITPAIQSVVEFAKRIPGFSDLSQDDQLILIKSGFFEVWLTRMARMFNRVDNLVTFEDGSMIQRDELAVIFSVSLRMIFVLPEEADIKIYRFPFVM